MSDTISQDQIDALLNPDNDGEGDIQMLNEGAEGGAEGGKNYDSITSFFELFDEHTGSVLSSVLNTGVELKLSESSAADPNKLSENVKAPALLVKIPVSGGIKGEIYTLIEKKHAALIADLMLMGDGSAEYSEDHKDAMSELFSQVAGSFCSAAGERVGGTVSAGGVEVGEFDYNSPSILFEGADMSINRMTISGQDKGEILIGVVLPDSFSSDVSSAFASNGKSAAEKSGGGAGLNEAELDDLSAISGGDFSGMDDTFRETSLSGGEGISTASGDNVEMLLDIEMDVSIELGRADLSVKRILELAPGAIVELDRMAGEPVDLLVNGKVVAKGEVVVVDENFGIRIVSLVSPEERIKSLR